MAIDLERKALNQFTKSEIEGALLGDGLSLNLGPYVMGLSTDRLDVLPFLIDLYGNVPTVLKEQGLCDVNLRLAAPNLLRKHVRPQVSPDPGFEVPTIPLPVSLSGLALEMGFNLSIALQMFRHMIIHGGAVADEKGAILISAASGGGKSTLVSALMEQGFRLFSDEFGILDTVSNLLLPYPRPVSLKNESIEIVRGFAEAGSVGETYSGTPKGRIAYRKARKSDIEQDQVASAPKLILFPAYDKGAKPFARKLEPAEAIMRIIPSSTNYHIIGEAAYLALMHLIKSAEAYEIHYSNVDESLHLVNDLWAKVPS